MLAGALGRPFRLLRYFSLAALLSVALATLGLSHLYRQLAVADLTMMGEAHNVTVTRIFASQIWPEFGPFLRSVANADGDALRAHPEVKRLHAAILERVRGTSVLKIKIYAMNGRTVYSSEAKQIGEDRSGNPGFVAARNGNALSELTHRNRFSAFEQVVEQRGVLSSYVPVRNASGTVEGVFEVYDDITGLVELLEHTQARVTLVAAAVLLILYGALFAIVLRADRILRGQHAAHEAHEAGLESRIAERTAELQRARDAAQAANETKSRFLASMSHEIRTPLNGVLGMADLLRRTPLGDEQQRYCDAIASSGRALRDLLGDILDLAKIEAGKVEIEREDFEPSRMLGDLAVAFRELSAARGNAFHASADLPAQLRLRGDALRLRQVLTNLLSNAVKFTENGRIEVRAQALDPRPGDFRQWLRFTVQDTGIGMSAETVARLFTPFEQADVSTTRQYGGSGLGLTIARHLLDLMGGTLAVESAPGSGTTFRADLPLEAAQAGPAQAAAPSPVAQGGAPLAVLLVEDNEINQEVALAMLKGAAHQVEVAAEGAEAVRKYAPGRYDCVLMDCQMPGMDGFEATRRIRAREAGEGGVLRVPIVALTANAMAGDRERCLEAGMDDFLSKPFDSASLLAAVARNARRATPRSDGAAVPASFDPVALDELVRMDAEAPGLLAKLAGLFRDGSPALIASVAGAAENSVAQAQRAAHTLKSTGARFGAKALAELAAQAETAAREGRLDATRVLGQAMMPEFARASSALAAHLEEIAAARRA